MEADRAAAQPKNPLHGKTLEMILNHLVTHVGWKDLGQRITIRCFTENPSIRSSLKFLRKTPWARKKVERLYLLITPGTPLPLLPSAQPGIRKQARAKPRARRTSQKP
jgi:uncharacterized protein (DUF2132 family)